MSHMGGRGFGRAGRGTEPRKAPEEQKPMFITSKGRFRGARKEQGDGDQPRVGYPSTSRVEEVTAQAAALRIDQPKKGGNGNGDSSDSGNGNGDGYGRPSVGRGGVRGRRLINITDPLRTKPETCTSKQGTFGNQIRLLTNYFKIETLPDWVIYQYRVDFSVEEEREGVMRSWLKQHQDRLATAYIFDGTMLFTSRRLTVGKEPLSLTSIRDGDNAPVQIEIRLVQQLNSGNAVYLQVFNILVRRCLLHLQLQLVNRNYFDPKGSTLVERHKLEVWPGYITSIRQHENDVLMCSEITHKVMRTDTALKILSEIIKEVKDYKKVFQQAMVGNIILTDYNNKTYRIDDVDFDSSPLSTFNFKNEQITYVKYYQQRYNIKITDMKQPLLVSRLSARDVRAGKDRQCLLLPELCRMTGLSSDMLSNRGLMKDLADVTRVPPNARIDKLMKFNQRLQAEKKVAQDFEEWGMKIGRNLLTVPARLLPPEQIIAGRSTAYSAASNYDIDWTKSLRSNPMYSYGRFDSLVVICPSRMKRDIEDFLGLLKKAADGMGIKIPKPTILEVRSDNPSELLETVEHAVSKIHPSIILFGFLNERADRYSIVKKKCYVDRGVPSQVVLLKSMKSKAAMTIATKIAIQMNCKLGGAPWTVNIPTEDVMVIGFDVCHDKDKRKGSVGALVASLDKALSSWFSSVNHHSSGEELSDSLPVDLCKAIQKYKEYNKNTLPRKIIVYRDGVGEGQIPQVYNHEVENLKRLLSELYGKEPWKLCYIIVTKRINTRFFHDSQNPKPGTIVDDVVTLPQFYDFFLVSQSVRQGTVSPTSYNVISDNLGWSPNNIQRFTYKMTHLYFNCSVTTRVPAPCQYAHKLAFMVSQNLQSQPHPRLNTTLYYL